MFVPACPLLSRHMSFWLLFAAASAGACAGTFETPQSTIETVETIEADGGAPAADAEAESLASDAEAASGSSSSSEPPVLMVLRQGDTPPGGDGLAVAGVGLATTDGNGLVAFTGRLDDGGTGDGTDGGTDGGTVTTPSS